MSLVSASQHCVPVSSLAQAAAVAADVSERKLINLDTSSQAQSHLPLIRPLKLGHTWEFTHLLSRSSTQTHKRAATHWARVRRTHSHAFVFVVSMQQLSHGVRRRSSRGDELDRRCQTGSVKPEWCTVNTHCCTNTCTLTVRTLNIQLGPCILGH